MSGSGFGLGYLLGMFGVVAFGAVIPVVPTGAAVSVGAALAERDHIVLPVLVVAFGAAGAYLGDILTYAVLRLAGRAAGRRSNRRSAPGARLPAWLPHWWDAEQRALTLARVNAEIENHELRTLLLSRLVPGGRIPVLLAAAVGGYPWRRFAVADLAAATLWASVYAAIGLLGRVVFPEPWQAVVAAIALVLLVSLISNRLARRRQSAPTGRQPIEGRSEAG
ncbi:MAG: DedA family protein [Jatrophihabitans sp.]